MSGFSHPSTSTRRVRPVHRARAWACRTPSISAAVRSGGRNDAGVDAVHEPVGDVGADFPADVADEPGDEQTRDGVCPAQPGQHADQPSGGAGRRQRVEPGVVGVGDHCRGVDTAAYGVLVTRNGLMMLVFVGALIALGVWLLPNTRAADHTHAARAPSADEVLAEWLARGEIDEDDYTRRRELLRNAWTTIATK